MGSRSLAVVPPLEAEDAVTTKTRREMLEENRKLRRQLRDVGLEVAKLQGQVSSLLLVIAEHFQKAAPAKSDTFAEERPKCAFCGGTATCFGFVDDGADEYACDECCNHDDGDGACKPIAFPAAPAKGESGASTGETGAEEKSK